MLGKIMEGTTWRALYSRFYGLAVRASIINRAVNRAVSNMNSLEAIDVIKESLANPALMRDLLREANDRTAPTIIRRLRAHVPTLAARVNLDDEEE